ncbi:MAG TPA: hypothetical protein VIK10_01250 [Prolixibacteraceae bacterium]
MKTKLLFFAFTLLTINLAGQEVKDSTIVKPVGRKNVIKFLPVNLVFNSLSFEYERKFTPKSSFILGVGFPSSKPFPSMINLNSGSDKITNDVFSTMSIRAAYRHYSGHRIQPSGFYFSPYFKYQKINASADYLRTGTDPNGNDKQYQEKYSIDGSTINFGVQSGVQFLIAKRVAVDFYFLGFEAGLASITATVKSTDTNMINEVESNVRDNLDQLPSFLAKKIKVNRNGTDQVDVTGTSIPYPWFRSGISLGIAF